VWVISHFLVVPSNKWENGKTLWSIFFIKIYTITTTPQQPARRTTATTYYNTRAAVLICHWMYVMRVWDASRGGKKRGKKLFLNAWCIRRFVLLHSRLSTFRHQFRTERYSHTHTHTRMYVYKCIRAAHGGKNEIKHETHNPRFTTTPPRLQPCTYYIIYAGCNILYKIYQTGSSSPCVRTATVLYII